MTNPRRRVRLEEPMAEEFRRALTEEEVVLFLGQSNHSIFATINPDGTPHMTPIGYEYDRGVFNISTTTDKVKYRNVRGDSRVSLLVRGQLPGEPGEAVVMASGPATVERDEGLAVFQRIAGRGSSPEVAQRLYEDRKDEPRVVICFRPTKMLTWVQIGRSAVS